MSSVHVRLEDELSHTKRPISAGVAVESVTVQEAQVSGQIVSFV